MKKNDNDWNIQNIAPINGEILKEIEINTNEYVTTDDIACICHAILLLVDAVNDMLTDAVNDKEIDDE